MQYDNLPLGLAITSDEERGGNAGMRYLFDEVGLRCNVAMIPDGGSLNEVTVEEKGILHLKIQCNGTFGTRGASMVGKQSIGSSC